MTNREAMERMVVMALQQGSGRKYPMFRARVNDVGSRPERDESSGGSTTPKEENLPDGVDPGGNPQKGDANSDPGSAEPTECTPSDDPGLIRVAATMPLVGGDAGSGLLPTFRAKIGVPGKAPTREVRVLMDSGAQMSLCATNLARALGVACVHVNIRLGSAGSAGTQQLTEAGVIELHSLHSDYVYPVTVVLIPCLAGRSKSIDYHPYDKFPSARSLQQELADVWPQPKGMRFEVLLGQDYLWPLMRDRPFWPSEGGDRGPVFIRTPFGVVMQGLAPGVEPVLATADPPEVSDWQDLHTSLAIPHTKGKSEKEIKEPSIERLLRRLWCLESIGISLPPETGLTQTEQYAVDYLEKHLEYLPEKRKFRVQLPIDPKKPSLINNRYAAQGRLDSTLANLARYPSKKELYVKAMQKYLDKDHCARVTKADEQAEDIFYLPHSGVLEPVAGTDEVKVRIVFDCSAKDRMGNSLNDILVTGPVPDAKIPRILTTWRNGVYAFNMDVKDCFLNILLHPNNQNLFRFLWYPHGDTTKEPTAYKFTSLIFGSKCSPWISSTCLWKLLELNEERYPGVVARAKRGLWVDDILLSTDSVNEAQDYIHKLEEIFDTGSFALAKFVASDERVLAQIKEEQRLFPVGQRPRGRTKALGVDWDLERDTLSIDRELTTAFSKAKRRGTQELCHTKRTLSRMVATVYDPLQILAPWKVGGTLLLKQAWEYHHQDAERRGISKTAKCLWDEPLPKDMERQIDEWASEYPLVNTITIPRGLKRNEKTRTQEVWGFCDASPLAFGCVVYLKTTYKRGPPTSRFVLARTKVNPPKALSLPRSELVAAKFLSTAVLLVKEFLQLGPETRTYLFGDSMIALHWLKQEPSRWKVFVANAVTVIQAASRTEDWYHVPGEDNPADLLTRPHKLQELQGEMGTYWFEGPPFILTGTVPPQPDFTKVQSADVLTELKRQVEDELTVNVEVVRPEKRAVVKEIFERISDTTKAVRVVAWVLRALRPKTEGPTHYSLCLTQADMDAAMDAIAVHIQKEAFHETIRELARNGKVKTTDKLAALNPYLDDRGALRARGRVEAQHDGVLTREWAEPLIMPSSSEIMGRLIRWVHEKFLHGGTDLVHAQLRQRWWIQRGRASVQKYIHRCMECRKMKGKAVQQQMAPLPPERSALGERPFTHIAIDGLGPVLVQVPKSGTMEETEAEQDQGKKKKLFVTAKRWLLVISCMTTRAVNVEVLDNLFAESFVHALRRHFATYGLAKSVRLDNLRAHIKMSKELDSLMKKTFVHDLHAKARELGLVWSWSTVGQPSTNGVIERCVRMVKECLFKSVGRHKMNQAQLVTFAREATSIINSRPLGQVHQGSTEDYQAITPNHLLFGHAWDLLPLGTEHMDRRSRDVQKLWKERMAATREFWLLFQDQYLSTLLERKKWKKEEEAVQVGDLCLVQEPGRKRRDWPLGVVDQLMQNRQDGLVRTVRVRMAEKHVTRSVRSLIFLRHLEDYLPTEGEARFTDSWRDPARDRHLKFIRAAEDERSKRMSLDESDEGKTQGEVEALTTKSSTKDEELENAEDETPKTSRTKKQKKKTGHDRDVEITVKQPQTNERKGPRTRLQTRLERERAQVGDT